MSTLRVSNIEAKADPSSPTVNEKVKITNSNGDVMLQLDGATSGITTVGINTTTAAFTVDGAQNINFVGVVTAASLSGNLAGDVNAGVITATSSIVVGDAFINSTSIGIGTTTTAGRNAGVGTAVGTIVYNETTGTVEIYKRATGWVQIDNVGDTNDGMTATGGIISDYESGGNYYRSHTFTSSGTFEVTLTPSASYGSTVDYLIVGGGGGGGGAGGGGAGLLHYKTAQPVSATSYPIVIGAGAQGSKDGINQPSFSGGDTTAFGETASGGGGGGAYSPNSPNDPVAADGKPGGSGGGGGFNYPGTAPLNGGTGSGDSGHPGGIDQTSPPLGWGNDGGTSGYTPLASYTAGAGGGAAAVGGNATAPASGAGGAGARYTIRDGSEIYYAGGGGGGAQASSLAAGAGGDGGGGGGGGWSGATWGLGGADGGQPGAPGGSGSISPPYSTAGSPTSDGWGGNGGQGTGGGGGGQGISVMRGGNGGSGVAIVRYQIAAPQTSTAKATGGNISFYGGKTIHTFTSSGTFANPTALNGGSPNPLTVEMVLIGGGGGGGWDRAGGGGAGSYVHATSMPIASASSHAVIIGAGGVEGRPGGVQGTSQTGNPSSYNSTTIIANGGGRGGSTSGPTPLGAGGAGGSGGGGAAYGPGAGGAATAPPTSPAAAATSDPGGKSYQSAGGTGAPTGAHPYSAGGGGGAGGAGTSGPGPASPYTGLAGGAGLQLPATFRDPKSTLGFPGPNGGGYWVAGGGGGGSTDNGTGGPGGGHPDATSSWAGGGIGGFSPVNTTPGRQPLGEGRENTGAGGGGGGNQPNAFGKSNGYRGGSGLVIIAYPT